jgi:hypothetical protein
LEVAPVDELPKLNRLPKQPKHKAATSVINDNNNNGASLVNDHVDNLRLFESLSRRHVTSSATMTASSCGDVEASKGLGRLPSYLPSASSLLSFGDNLQNPYREYEPKPYYGDDNNNNNNNANAQPQNATANVIAAAPSSLMQSMPLLSSLPSVAPVITPFQPASAAGAAPPLKLASNLPLPSLAELLSNDSKRVVATSEVPSWSIDDTAFRSIAPSAIITSSTGLANVSTFLASDNRQINREHKRTRVTPSSNQVSSISSSSSPSMSNPNNNNHSHSRTAVASSIPSLSSHHDHRAEGEPVVAILNVRLPDPSLLPLPTPTPIPLVLSSPISPSPSVNSRVVVAVETPMVSQIPDAPDDVPILSVATPITVTANNQRANNNNNNNNSNNGRNNRDRPESKAANNNGAQSIFDEIASGGVRLRPVPRPNEVNSAAARPVRPVISIHPRRQPNNNARSGPVIDQDSIEAVIARRIGGIRSSQEGHAPIVPPVGANEIAAASANGGIAPARPSFRAPVRSVSPSSSIAHNGGDGSREVIRAPVSASSSSSRRAVVTASSAGAIDSRPSVLVERLEREAARINQHEANNDADWS